MHNNPWWSREWRPSSKPKSNVCPEKCPHVEFTIENDPWTKDLYQPALQVRDGKVAIPSGPGWGVTINPEWLNKAKSEVSKRS
jgi:hypothetical protein